MIIHTKSCDFLWVLEGSMHAHCASHACVVGEVVMDRISHEIWGATGVGVVPVETFIVISM
jgi:hypothetical protein